MEAIPKLVFVGFWLFVLVMVVLFCFGLKRVIVYLMEKHITKEYYANAPKVNTNLCDKGHLYPADLALRLENIPGLEHDVPLCPICFDKNMSKAEEMIRSERVRATNEAESRGDTSSRVTTIN